MLFRRKPKAKPNGEEPLVPHGLIWQATAQEQPQSAPGHSSPALNQKLANDARFDRPPSARKLGAISPPIAWPSPRIQEIPRRPHSRAETELIAAVAMGQVIPVPYTEPPRPSPVVVPKIEPPRPQVLEARETVALPSPPPKIRTPLRERFPGLRDRLHAVQKSWASARLELGGNFQALIANLRERIHLTGEVLSTYFHRALTWPRSLKSPIGAVLTTSATATHRLLSRRKAVWRRVEIGFRRSAAATEQPRPAPVVVPKIEPPRPQVLEARETVALPSPPPKIRTPLRERFPGLRDRLHAVQKSWASARLELGAVLTTSATATHRLLSRRKAVWRRVEIGFRRSAAAMSGVWRRKIRVGVDSACSRPIATLRASVSGWKSKAFRLKFDSRLWTSMAMAGASAGLALGMISLVRHYSPEAAPVHTRSFRSPAAPVKHVKASNSVSHSNVGTRPVVEKPSAARTAAPPSRVESAPKSAKLPARKVQARKPRSRNSEDDDYVARDTYVYYGTSGQNGR